MRWLVPIVLVVVAVVAAVSARSADQASTPEPYPEVAAEPGPATPVLSARRYPSFLVTPTADDALLADLEAWVAAVPPQTCLSVRRDGRDLLAHNPDLGLIPASAEKLVTAAAVLDVLGAEATFTTTVAATDDLADGIIEGDLWLDGGGDPVLATDDYVAAYTEPPLDSDLEALADRLVADGLTRITGGVRGDESRYDTVRYVEVWPERFIDQNQTGPLGALTVNDAFVAYPDADFARSAATAASDPALHAAEVFDDLLEARGVLVEGAAGVGPVPDGAVTLATHQSPPVGDIVADMVSSSDNASAELLVKELGVADGGAGSTAAGLEVMRRYLSARSLLGDDVALTDGSGLSEENRLTCTLLVELLESAGPGPLVDGLAVAGESGTLRLRYVGTELEGRLRAKTGTLNDVTALAGFVDTESGETLTFAMMINEPGVGVFGGPAIALQDALTGELVQYPEGVDLEALDPEEAPA